MDAKPGMAKDAEVTAVAADSGAHDDMNTNALTTLEQPVGLRSDCIVSEPTAFVMQQHKAVLTGDYTATLANGQTLIKTSASRHWDWGRKFADGSDLPLYTLRKRSRSGFGWKAGFDLNLPNKGETIASFLPVDFSSTGDTRVTITFRNNVSEQREEITLIAVGRPSGMSIQQNGRNIASLKRSDYNFAESVTKREARWECEVAAKFDRGLVAVMVVVFTELLTRADLFN